MCLANGRSRIYRCHNQRYAANCVLEQDRFGGGNAMVWTGIHHQGHTVLVRVIGALDTQIYRDEVVQHHVFPLINVTGGTFQHGNARPHTAKDCR